VQFKIWDSFDFEVLALFFNACLLFYYKSGASRDETEKLGYFNNSLFLKQYRKIQHVFFAAIVFDACFALTFIQMIMLAFTFGLLIIWAKLGNKQPLNEEKKKEDEKSFKKMISISTMCIRILVNIQLASLSFF